MAVCVLVGLGNPLMGPVGAAECTDLPLGMQAVEDLHNLSHRHLGIVPVQKINIDVIRPEVSQRLSQILADILLVDTLSAKGTGVPALA